MTNNNDSQMPPDDKNLAAKGEAEPAPDLTSGVNQAKTDSNERVFTQEELDRIIAKRLKEAQAKWEKTKDLSEVERLKSENEELRQKVMLADAFSEFEKTASKMGVRNVRGLFKVLQSDLKFNKDGEAENLADLLKEAKTEFPEFFAPLTPGSADAGRKSERSTSTDMNAIIRKSLGYGR